jgi:hypothetical protein
MVIHLQCFHRRFLVMNLTDGDSSASVTRWLTLHSWTLNSQLLVASTVFKITPRNGPGLFVVKNACLLASYLAMAICEPYREHLLRRWFHCCVRVFRELPRNGSTYHNILKVWTPEYLPAFSETCRLLGMSTSRGYNHKGSGMTLEYFVASFKYMVRTSQETVERAVVTSNTIRKHDATGHWRPL